MLKTQRLWSDLIQKKVHSDLRNLTTDVFDPWSLVMTGALCTPAVHPNHLLVTQLLIINVTIQSLKKKNHCL